MRNFTDKNHSLLCALMSDATAGFTANQTFCFPHKLELLRQHHHSSLSSLIPKIRAGSINSTNNNLGAEDIVIFLLFEDEI